MSFDLHSKTGDYCFNIDLFQKVLRLALAFDWIPLGTTAPHYKTERDDWMGGYLSNDSQYVTPEDAFNLAEALERVLENIPDLDETNEATMYPPQKITEERGITEMVKEAVSGLKSGFYVPESEERSQLLYEFGNSEMREYLSEFIDFCKTGEGFTIS
jgi:hypothetical protein